MVRLEGSGLDGGIPPSFNQHLSFIGEIRHPKRVLNIPKGMVGGNLQSSKRNTSNISWCSLNMCEHRALLQKQKYELSTFCIFLVTHRIHGTDIFTYICHKHQPNVGKYTVRPMDPMG